MRTAAFALAAFLAACATSPPPAQTTRITFEISSWGYVQDRWSISATGEATRERVPVGGQLTTPTVSQTFTLTPADFERIRAALAPAEPLIDNIECNRVIYDLPYGAVKWQRADGAEDIIRFDLGCDSNRGLDLLFERIEMARAAFREAAAAP